MKNNSSWQGWGSKIGYIGYKPKFQSWLTMYPTVGYKPQKLDTTGNRHNVGWIQIGYSFATRLKELVNNNFLDTFWIQRKSTIKDPGLYPCFQKT